MVDLDLLLVDRLIDEKAEREVLGGLLVNPALFGKALEYKLSSVDFYFDTHRKIYDALFELYLENQSSKENVFKKIKGDITKEFISSLIKQAPSDPDYLDRAIWRVKELSQKRNLLFFLIHTSSRIEQEDVERIAKDIIVFLDNFGLKEKKSVDYETLASDIFEFKDRLDGERKSDFLSNIPTGFTDLDMLTGGFGKGELIVLSAPAGMGKTSFMLSAALNIAKQGRSVGIASFKLDKDALYERLSSIMSYVPLKRIRQRFLNDEEMEKIAQSVVELSTLKIFILHSAWFTFSELYYKTRRLKEEKGLDILFVDHLQLMSADRRRNTREEELEEIVRNLKTMARRLEIPVVLLVQTEARKKYPELEDLKNIGKIEQFADIILFLYRPEYYRKHPSPDEMGIAEIIAAKNRQDATDMIRLAFIKETTAFKSLEGQLLQNIYEGFDEDDLDLDF
ncbi:MAG: DnaB-like helicase C-terminal domain-containing protein [Nitrososphaerales archaeon]